VSCPLRGYIVSFVVFHERGFSVSAGRFIRVVLHEYELQLQHLNPNSVQQMVVFEVLCEGYLGIGAHWDLFKYFFMFACLKDGPLPATISCANLRMKQDGGEKYIPFSLMSFNNDWHKGWFYLRNDPEHTMSKFTGVSITQALRSWSDGPPKTEQEKVLKEHWAALARLHHAGVDLAAVIG
jgi:hypothetical protein